MMNSTNYECSRQAVFTALLLLSLSKLLMFILAPVLKHCKPVTFLRIRDQVSYPHGTKVETAISYILSF